MDLFFWEGGMDGLDGDWTDWSRDPQEGAIKEEVSVEHPRVVGKAHVEGGPEGTNRVSSRGPERRKERSGAMYGHVPVRT